MALGTLVTAGLGLVQTIFTEKQKTARAKEQNKRAASEERTKLIQCKQSNNAAWEIAVLEEDNLGWLRFISFTLVIVPVVVTVFDPDYGKEIWGTLETVPTWVIGLLVTMYGFIWASKELNQAGARRAATKIASSKND